MKLKLHHTSSPKPNVYPKVHAPMDRIQIFPLSLSLSLLFFRWSCNNTPWKEAEVGREDTEEVIVKSDPARLVREKRGKGTIRQG